MKRADLIAAFKDVAPIELSNLDPSTPVGAAAHELLALSNEHGYWLSEVVEYFPAMGKKARRVLAHIRPSS